ncbi:hypothetical protein ACFY94_17510 [Streptomyces griseorubiginosus]|uniref:hypothetical protein n=1 Tax=Streptomyces griseorubiginosus TaxID=67304 RepID=UPI0036E767D9
MADGPAQGVDRLGRIPGRRRLVRADHHVAGDHQGCTEVGRDVTPHLQNQPRYAHGELVARVSPLYAYLGAHPVTPRHPVDGAKGRRLTWNPVYAHGTERSAKVAAGYRLGMTMTEWACRSLLGLGQTEHLELGGPIPALLKTFKDPKKKLPDLWGHHEAEQLYWLIEAKGGDVGLKKLREGWEQLAAGSKVLGGVRAPHRPGRSIREAGRRPVPHDRPRPPPRPAAARPGASECVVAVAEAVFQVSRACCFVVGIGSGSLPPPALRADHPPWKTTASLSPCEPTPAEQQPTPNSTPCAPESVPWASTTS